MNSDTHNWGQSDRRPHRLGAVVVTYKPAETLSRSLNAIRPQVETLLVLDNSQDLQMRERVEQCTLRTGAEYLGQKANLGIAGALNVGFRQLRDKGFTHAIAFDQDSTPSPESCTKLLLAATAHPDMAVLGSDWSDEAAPQHRARHVSANAWLPFLFRRRGLPPGEATPMPVSFAIMSGSCFDLKLWQQIGGFDESLMLDLVDQDYCLRAQDRGLRVALLPGARLWHRRGEKRPVRCLGKTWYPSFIPPNRLRCMFHNRTRLIGPWLLHHPHMAAYEAVYSLKLLFDICLLESDSWRKLKAVFRGIIDGLRGRPLKL